jgi:murein DD-endopeptidase MepM/ murein hydrolase activator NlpD
MLCALLFAALPALWQCSGTRSGERQGSAPGEFETRLVERVVRTVSGIQSGVVLPYPTHRILSTFGDCRDGGRRQHRGLDLGGVGDDQGLGTPIRSMFRARITLIGTGSDDPDRFGHPDTRDGIAERGGHRLARSGVIPGYGVVRWFTRDYGAWRSGTIVSTEVVEGDWEGYRVRYMHLGAVYPGLAEGDIVEAGQELGLMGGTAIQFDSPHVHIDMEDLQGDRVDIAPLLGLEADTRTCGSARGRR